jgi:hypothetical protein
LTFEGLSRKNGALGADSQGIPETSWSFKGDFLVVSDEEPGTET